MRERGQGRIRSRLWQRQKTDAEDQAREYTPDKVSDFLASIKLGQTGQYAQAFLNEEINRSQRLSADRKVFSDIEAVIALTLWYI
uniref:Uncharacterized protein n=1 Tax=Amphimedon queenslandica TaxID=400682 RepID=A0A1X7U893_AMPQE